MKCVCDREGGRVTHLWAPDILLSLKIHDKHIRRLHEFLLHATRRNEDLVAMFDTCTTACARYLVHPSY